MMKFDMVVAGVGGQGILSISFVVDNAAMEENLHFKQSEVHGMAQRGGSVVSHLRVSDHDIYSDLVPVGSADLVVSMEPLETLRFMHFTGETGNVIASTCPFVNIPNYPDIETVYKKIQMMRNHTLVNSADLARAAGSHYAQNMVMLGAACHKMPLQKKTLEKFIGLLFKTKGEKIVNINIAAFRSGDLAGSFYRSLLEAGLELHDTAVVATRLKAGEYSREEIQTWVELCSRSNKQNMLNWLKERKSLLKVGCETLTAISSINFDKATAEDFETAVRID